LPEKIVVVAKAKLAPELALTEAEPTKGVSVANPMLKIGETLLLPEKEVSVVCARLNDPPPPPPPVLYSSSRDMNYL
jgi:hypothetical protein